MPSSRNIQESERIGSGLWRGVLAGFQVEVIFEWGSASGWQRKGWAFQVVGSHVQRHRRERRADALGCPRRPFRGKVFQQILQGVQGEMCKHMPYRSLRSLGFVVGWDFILTEKAGHSQDFK